MSSPRKRNRRLRPVLLVGQTPPPFHGQALMLQRIAEADFEQVEVLHIRLAYSKSMDDVGRFQLGKLVHLLCVILQVYWLRLTRRPDVLYYPPAGPNLIPMWRDIVFLLSTRWLFSKTVFHMQAGGISELGNQLTGLTAWLFRRAYFKPDAVVRLSELTPEDAGGLHAAAEFIVPNCVEDEFEPFKAIAAQRRTDEPRILYLGTVCETKGVLDLLTACEGLKESEQSLAVDIVGSFQPAGFESVVRQHVERCGLQDVVTLHGQLTGDAKLEALAQSDIFCFPSYYPSEAFPCVLVEAMSFELPVVTTRWRGIPSIVDECETGYMVETRDCEGLERHLRTLLRDSSLRQKLGENGRKKFLKRYTTAIYLRMIESVLLNVQSPHSPVAGAKHVEISTT